MLTGNGLIVVIAGYQQEYGDKQQAWSYTMIVVGLIMTLITVYNYIFNPKIEVNNAVTIAKSTSDKSLAVLLPFSKETNWFVGFHSIIQIRESQLKNADSFQ
jgi:PAT family beta-lactamase induction signal transducer AmpG